ncbi:MAG: beta-lactamase family protein, partial [Candidatus Aminicenantes bacterium]|nr:beta-lactamase family protein [Candidatus Aminicenantes bacterium]
MPEWIAELKSPAGAAWAVVDDKTVLLEGVHGHTNGPGKPPVTTRTLFSIQSMSKSFTALGVLAAVRDGLLDLDAPIKDTLPEFTVHSRFEEHPERLIT